jgi:hypothetical protein
MKKVILWNLFKITGNLSILINDLKTFHLKRKSRTFLNQINSKVN